MKNLFFMDVRLQNYWQIMLLKEKEIVISLNIRPIKQAIDRFFAAYCLYITYSMKISQIDFEPAVLLWIILKIDDN